jgi:4'-phosphopantetheinyl transferase
MGLEQLKDNEAHLWWAQPDRVADPCLLRRYRDLLSDEERERIERYHFPKDRHAGLITRAMVRCLLSRYVAVEPSRWRFRANQHGRPEIAEPSIASALRFSIAHTDGMIVVLISKNRDVGVDVECLPYRGPCLEIAERFFSPTEISILRSLDASDRPSEFIKYWTLKESYIKARGTGLSTSLTDFFFRVQENTNGKTGIFLVPPSDDVPERWQFSLDFLGPQFLVATAIERHDAERLNIVRNEISSLSDVFKMS